MVDDVVLVVDVASVVDPAALDDAELEMGTDEAVAEAEPLVEGAADEDGEGLEADAEGDAAADVDDAADEVVAELEVAAKLDDAPDEPLADADTDVGEVELDAAIVPDAEADGETDGADEFA